MKLKMLLITLLLLATFNISTGCYTAGDKVASPQEIRAQVREATKKEVKKQMDEFIKEYDPDKKRKQE